MPSNELKISIDGLEIGMFVSRLDKPWIDTPFSLEGLPIRCAEDIKVLRRYTSYVFVNTEEGPTPDPKYWVTFDPSELAYEGGKKPPVEADPEPRKNEYTRLKRVFYEIETSFEEEINTARIIKSQIKQDFKNILEHISENQTLDVEQLKKSISAAVSSILRNPSAFSLLTQLEKSDEYSYSHALSTSIWCAQFGRHLGLERKDIEQLALGGMLLDVGKVKLPQALLHKKEAITAAESELIRQHVDHSVRMLAKSGSVSQKLLRMVATHHERYNGSGYPEGLKGKKIPIFGRIAGIVDSFDAMTTTRPYSAHTYSPNDAINELYQLRDSSFQAELVEQFIQTVGLYPTGSLVELNSGAVAVVIEVNDLKRLFPTVMMLLDKDKQPLEEFVTIDLSTDNKAGLLVEKALPQGAFGIKLEELFL